MGFSIGDIELKFKMEREKGVGRKRRGNSAFQYFDRTGTMWHVTKSIFSVVREDDSVFAHKTLTYDGKDELN
jgi:hypothetical protein